LIISEFRRRGPSGANDEYVELYNPGSSPVTVSTSDASAGWALAASPGGIRFTVPNGTVIPAHGHYLGVNSVAYSLASYPAGNGTTATGDATYTTDIPDNAGIALFNTANPANFTLANRLDAVGSVAEANTLYKEGVGYATLTPFSIDYTFYRNLNNANGAPLDTDNNATDFLFADTQGTPAGPPQRLGTPGPENLSSPTQRNATIKASLIDPGCSGSGPVDGLGHPTTVNACARQRDTTAGAGATSTFGTLSI